MRNLQVIISTIILFLFVALASEVLVRAQQQDVLPQSTRAQKFSLIIDKELVTATIRDQPLSYVLDQVSARSHVTITFDHSLGAENVDVEIIRLPVDAALRHVLSKHDAFYYYRAGNDGASKLHAVWVYPKSTAAAMKPVPSEACARNDELLASASDADPVVRERAYEALLSRPDARSRDVVIAAIRGFSEKDAAVRERLLSRAVTSEVLVPPDVLADLARADNSEQIRWIALDSLAGDPAVVRPVAEAALNDTSEAVRARAKEILREASAATQRLQSDAQPNVPR